MRGTPIRDMRPRETHAREMHAYERHRMACVLCFPTPDALKSQKRGHRKQTRPHSERGTGLQRPLLTQLARTYSTIGRNAANQPTTANHIPVNFRFRLAPSPFTPGGTTL
jgi:alpha-D-ribose 1-methylphosphonate 5-phosphate C-P lyase